MSSFTAVRLGAFHRRLKARLGAPKAITATAHKLACLIYRMLRFGTDYVDRGQDYYERRHQAGSSPISCAGLTNSATPSPGLKVPRHLPWRPREEVTWKKSTSATCNEGREFLFLAASAVRPQDPRGAHECRPPRSRPPRDRRSHATGADRALRGNPRASVTRHSAAVTPRWAAGSTRNGAAEWDGSQRRGPPRRSDQSAAPRAPGREGGYLARDPHEVRLIDFDAIAERLLPARGRDGPPVARFEKATRFFAAWTSNEALLTACGEGLAGNLARTRVTGKVGAARGPAARDTVNWSVTALHPGPGYAGALAVERRDWRLRCWQLPAHMIEPPAGPPAASPPRA